MDVRRWLLGLVLASAGCGNLQRILTDKRPPTNPAPIDVQAELRDARFFLPLPDRTIGPLPAFNPRIGGAAPSSD